MRAQINKFFSKKPWKYSLITVCISACLYAGDKACKLYRIDNPKIEQSANLIVNPSPYKRFVTKKSEREGISDLQKIVQTPGDEEAWLYIQDNDKRAASPKKDYWREVGVIPPPNIQLSREVNRLEKEIRRIMQENDCITDYHIHRQETEQSIKYMEEKLKRGIAKIEKNFPEKAERLKAFVEGYDRMIELFNALENARPSSGDLDYMIEYSEMFYKLNPSGKINFRIATENGITEYNLTSPIETSLEKIKKISKEQLAVYLDRLVYQAQIAVCKRNSHEPLSREEINSKIDEMSKLMSNNIIQVRFTPYEYYSEIKALKN